MARPALSPEQVATAREALLDVAQELYESGGIEAMSFRSIASAHGCSSSMPYSYFASKADLIDGLRVRSYQWMQGVLTVAASEADDPITALRGVAVAYVEAGLARPRIYELMYSTDGELAETAPALVEAKQAAINVCRGVIRAAAAENLVELHTDPDTAAHLFWVAAHGLVGLQHGGFLVVGRSIDDLLPVLLQTMVRGLTAAREVGP